MKTERLVLAHRLLARAEARDKRFLESALDATREGDDEGTWFGMASRAQNQRFIDRLKAEIAELEQETL